MGRVRKAAFSPSVRTPARAQHPAPDRGAGATRRRLAGFSLLELLVVMVIIGLLAGLVGPRLFSKVDESKQRTAEAQIKMLRGALQTMRLDLGRFPDDPRALDYLYQAPSDEQLGRNWRGPYLDEPVPLDPWGNPYRYEVPGAQGQPFALYSLGADGAVGGEGVDADLGYLP